MERAVKLALTNLGLTAVMLLACVFLALIVGAILSETTYAEGSKAPNGNMYSALERQILKEGARDSYMGFGLWVGLASSQIVFLVLHLERRGDRATDAGGRDETGGR
jgi:hypothetical protein